MAEREGPESARSAQCRSEPEWLNRMESRPCGMAYRPRIDFSPQID